MARDYDGYGFHVSKCQFENKAHRDEAFTLIQDMLKTENKYRLSQEYQVEYAKEDDSEWKSDVTERIQARVINEFLPDPRSKKLFTNMEDGIDFLRGAVGTFPEHLETLKSCANYVRFTQNCRRGSLNVGDTIDGKGIPLVDPYSLEQTSLSDYVNRSTSTARPLVLIASSYT